jgi:uncharacterized membrane protein HdeD (DUF308 family)
MIVDNDYDYDNFTEYSWITYVVSGIVLFLTGIAFLGYSIFAPIFSLEALGILLVLKGVFSTGNIIYHHKWKYKHTQLFVSIISIVIGVIMFCFPVLTAIEVTMLIAVELLLLGIIKIIVSCMRILHDWKWQLLNGLSCLSLGIIIIAGWPRDSLWILSILTGIDMILQGIVFVASGAIFHALQNRFSSKSLNDVQIHAMHMRSIATVTASIATAKATK